VARLGYPPLFLDFAALHHSSISLRYIEATIGLFDDLGLMTRLAPHRHSSISLRCIKATIGLFDDLGLMTRLAPHRNSSISLR